MENHIKLLAILMIVYGAIGVLAVLVVMLVFGGAGLISTGASGDAAPALIAGMVGVVISAFVLLTHLPALIVGFGLLKYRSWARILGIIISILFLLAFPIGTIVGIYGLWVLFQGGTIDLFEHRRPQTA